MVPKHIAIIMDGNGRWAKKRGLPRTAGHKAGIESLKEIIRTSSDVGVEHLTLYAFSTENWKRPKTEVNALFKLLVFFLRKEIQELHDNNVRIKVIGDYKKLPSNAVDEIEKALEKTSDNKGLTVNIALNYGGRDEIIHAIKKIVNDGFDSEAINEQLVTEYLYTNNVPDPDLLIRTSGEKRLSNFLLWQLAYTEFYFVDTLWPDFSSDDLMKAIEVYNNRNRRFGSI